VGFFCNVSNDEAQKCELLLFVFLLNVKTFSNKKENSRKISSFHLIGTRQSIDLRFVFISLSFFSKCRL
jgi:hypothetical protein